MKKCLWIGLTLSAFLLASCKEDNIEPTNVFEESIQENETLQEQESPIPLKIGNTWVYNRYKIQIDSTGAYTQKELVGTDTIKVLRDTIIENKTYFILSDCISCVYKTSNDKTEEKSYLRVEDKTLYSLSEKTPISLKTNNVHENNFNEYFKTFYSTTKIDNSNYNIIGEFWEFKENNKYKRHQHIDPFYIIDTSKGIIDSEVYYASSTKEHIIGFKKELVSFQAY